MNMEINGKGMIEKEIFCKLLRFMISLLAEFS